MTTHLSALYTFAPLRAGRDTRIGKYALYLALLRRAPTLKLQRKRKRLREGEDGNPDSYRDCAMLRLLRPQNS